MNLKELFDKHKKMHWIHEYAENGVVNFDDLNKIVNELNPIPNQSGLRPCPFCGEYPNYTGFTESYKDHIYIECFNEKCNVNPSIEIIKSGSLRTGSIDWSNKEDVKNRLKELWNKRV